MGIYIETPDYKNKAQQLIAFYGAEDIPKPGGISKVPKDKFLVPVVSNPQWDAAAVVYNAYEMRRLDQPHDTRPRKWLLMNKDIVRSLVDEKLAWDIIGKKL